MATMEGVAKEDSGSRVFCKVCVAKGKDSAPRTGCKICFAKAAAMNRIKAAGGDYIEMAAKAKGKPKPLGVVKAAELAKMTRLGNAAELARMKEEGGDYYIVKTPAKEDGTAPMVVTYRLTGAAIMSLPPPPLLRPLREDFFQKFPNRREVTCAGAATVLSRIEREEELLAQYVEYGYATVDLEVEDDVV